MIVGFEIGVIINQALSIMQTAKDHPEAFSEQPQRVQEMREDWFRKAETVENCPWWVWFLILS